MDPARYYDEAFPKHFKAFWHSLELKGSCSRMRAHQHQNFWGLRMGSPISNALQAEGGHFSVRDLYAQPDQDFPDHLAHVSPQEQVDFLCALFYIVLIDQAMYTHCGAEYYAFRALTHYPKMDGTVGWSGTMMMANPYDVFHSELLESRRLAAMDVLKRFEAWAKFIAADIRRLVREHKLGATTWEYIRGAMLHDYDCTVGRFGAVLRRHLLETDGIRGQAMNTP
ncbi:MAG: hypothetical protein NDI67_07245 [Sulfuritalea sp.]|nr:hypothetical protein [Sulfuritalea sp.]